MIPNPPPVTSPGIPVGPVPTAISVGQVRGPDAANLVLGTINTPQGVSHYFLPLDAGRQVAKAILRVCDAGHLSLVLPGTNIGNGPPV